MNILIIVLSLICAYLLFVAASYLLARLMFPKIEVDLNERPRMVRTKPFRRLTRAVR